MKKKLLCLLAVAVLASGAMSGCGRNKDTGMVDSEAVAVESTIDITGTWVTPGRDFTMEFNEDGTFVDSKKLATTEGTYQFMSQNAAFTIGDQFEEVHYISCVDEDGEAVYTGAVLGDLISGYNEDQKMERYYVRQMRDSVSLEDIVGSWEDANGDEYYAIIGEDGSLQTTDWVGTYEIGDDVDYGTTVTFHFEDYDEKYAVIRYEDFLFLYRDGTSNVYQLKPMTEDE